MELAPELPRLYDEEPIRFCESSRGEIKLHSTSTSGLSSGIHDETTEPLWYRWWAHRARLPRCAGNLFCAAGATRRCVVRNFLSTTLQPTRGEAKFELIHEENHSLESQGVELGKRLTLRNLFRSHVRYPIMTIKGFYLVGQSKELFHHEIHIDQYHDFEALQLAVAEQFNIIDPTGMAFVVISIQDNR